MINFDLTIEQKSAQTQFKNWFDEHIAPFADQLDEQQETPAELIETLAKVGYLGALVPKKYGGSEMDHLTWGLLCEEIGRTNASLLSLFTVHSMMIQAILKWGTDDQKNKWLPKLATGEVIGAFGLTEPNIGSDARHIESAAIKQDDGSYILNAQKRWISFGGTATLFVIFAQVDNQPAAFLVERSMNGFKSETIKGMLGFRSANIANISIKDVHIPASHVLGRPGFGFSHIASSALDQGRYCIAWGCVGLAQASLEASMSYAGSRHQFGKPIVEHQLIQEMLTEMIVQTKAARMLCLNAAYLKIKGEPALIMETSTAKYFASRVAVMASNSAVQIHGANGCSADYPVQRFFRDARIMEIIEGSTQMQQIIIARAGFQQHQVDQREQNSVKNSG
jgi:glutaryl-CoA dehydrogenase (non-decarboxylating)